MDQGNNDFLLSLAELGQWRPANVKVLITSRPVVEVESPLRPFHIPYLQLDGRLVDVDIAAYVQHRLRNSSVPHEYWDLVTEAVPGRANGLFLYAKLSMDAFVNPGADPKEVLKTLPIDLNVMYNNLLREHTKRSNVPDKFQLLLLQVVTHATRPLRLLEVAEMAKATHGPFEEYTLKEIKNLVRAACGPLIEILHDEIISVIHHSFTEFLQGFTVSKPLDHSTYSVLEAGPTNQRLAIACMDYLTSGCLDKVEIKQRFNKDEFFHPKKGQQSGTRVQFPFLEYAAANWHIHARRAALAGVDMSSFYMTLDDFVANTQRFVAWLDLDWPENEIQGLTPLHVAARTGLTQYARQLLQERDADPNAISGHGDTPLYWAAIDGHADVAQLLIDNGADPDGEANEGYKPLHKAASRNRADVAKVLLAAGVDPLTPKTQGSPGRRCGNAPTSFGQTPWMYACNRGHTETVAEFLPYIKDAETILQGLFWVTAAGYVDCVDLILRQPGMDVNSKYSGETLLFKACYKGDMKIIKFLLKAGADPNILCSYPKDEFTGRNSFHMRGQHRGDTKQTDEPRGYTALHALCGIRSRIGHRPAGKDCVSLLLEAGASVHSKCPDGKTALHFACAHNIEVVPVLLKAGADPTAETDSGSTILHTDGSTDKELLPILLGSGLVDVNELMTKGGNPLFTRLQGHHTDSIIELLKYKPDVNMARSNGDRPLHVLFDKFSSFSSDKHIALDALLSAGADPNLQNSKGETSLHLIGLKREPKAVSKLVNAGADLEIQDLEGQTALFKNVIYNKIADEKDTLSNTLIELGARLDTRDNKGRTLLHQAVRNTSSLDYLIARMDFDPAVVDDKGNTLFLEAASKKRGSVQLPGYIHLTKLGVDIDQPNNRGKTLLHKMCAKDCRLTSWNPTKKTVFDYVIEQCKNPSPRDVNGVQPLHVAAAISEDYVFKLLNAGADVFGTTNEGMTVLHVAARAQKPGVIGLVLSRLAHMEKATSEAFINQKSAEGDTALHYACRAGRPESVDFLLDAGADLNSLGKYGYTPLRACADFEVEQSRWWRAVAKDDTQKGITRGKRSGSIFLNLPPTADDLEERKPRSYDMQQQPDPTCLYRILVSLVLHGAESSRNEISLREAFHDAVLHQRDYTSQCLLRLQSRFFLNMNLLKGSDVEGWIASKSRLESKMSSLREEYTKLNTWQIKVEYHSRSRASYLQKLVDLRQYEMLEETMSNVDNLELDWTKISILPTLARFGLSDVLKRVCTRESACKFDDHEWCNQTEIANNIPRPTIEPLLIVACNREIPNMAVVRLLVEEMGVNISATSRKEVFMDNRKQRKNVSGHSVLHDIAQGKTWWNVHEALPYLIQKGADLEVRNTSGDTPLHIAVEENMFKGVFYKEAVQVLLEGGANANAVNNHGESCLSKAGTDTGLIKLLTLYGAKVSATAIFSAIELQQDKLLEAFLSYGDFANLRQSGVPPLFHAAFYRVRNNRVKDDDLTPARMRLMTTLLRHGADPYATLENGPESEWTFETGSLIHEILQGGSVTEPLLDLPSLRLETRDAKGQTLLLAASRSRHIKRFEDLLARGADITAQDQEGRTVVHNLMKHNPGEATYKCLEALFNQNPNLVHMPNKAGDTPLHYVLKSKEIYLNDYYSDTKSESGRRRDIDLLLEYGADPLQPDSDGNTALHFFAQMPRRFKSRIEQFQGLGVDINVRNKIGNSLVFEYIAHGGLRAGGPYGYVNNSEVKDLDDIHHLRYFKEAGVDFFARNDAGSSLLHVLAGRKLGNHRHVHYQEEITVPIENAVNWFGFLTGIGLDPMLEDAQQRTCLDVAAACDNQHILKLFRQKPID
jgi:ankyrin repeat protein